MSDKTESPALLSPERLAEIANRHANADKVTEGEVVQMPDAIPRYSVVCADLGFATCKTWSASNAFFYMHAHQDIPALLADRAAFRQQVAAELAALLRPEVYAEPELGERTYALHPDSQREVRQLREQRRIDKIRAVATRLGLDLSAPTP